MKILTVLIATLLAAVPGVAQAADKPALLILGTPHFGNPGRDIANVRVPDVTEAGRQRELAAIVDALAAFRPTRVAVEWPAARQADLDRRYADYRAGRYTLTADERDQIGLRLAARLGLARIDAVDWNDNPPGADADYDFPAWAEAHGRGAEWQAHARALQEMVNAEGRLMACTPISAWTRRLNTPEFRRESQRFYYDIAGMGDAAANPGAAWVGSWYARNLRILNNLVALAPQPTDRVVAIYGAGHGFLLDQQARESGRWDVADTLAFLPASPRDAWTRCPD